jgi:GDP-4-dehydro-6-deoxy-D-mannose reductase
VWDIETDDHVFHAGLGRTLLHNTGPRRGDVFVESDFARQVAEIEAGQRAPLLMVGDLTPQRDYSDVRDIVRGYWLLLERGQPGEVYNLCSGRSWAIRKVLDFLLAQSTVNTIAVTPDPARLRPSEVVVIEGDPSKIEQATGWKADIPFEQTLVDLLEYWRTRVRLAAG